MEVTNQVRKAIQESGKAAIYWLECAELARIQGDAPALALAAERAGFASNKAFAVAQQAAA